MHRELRQAIYTMMGQISTRDPQWRHEGAEIPWREGYGTLGEAAIALQVLKSPDTIETLIPRLAAISNAHSDDPRAATYAALTAQVQDVLIERELHPAKMVVEVQTYLSPNRTHIEHLITMGDGSGRVANIPVTRAVEAGLLRSQIEETGTLPPWPDGYETCRPDTFARTIREGIDLANIDTIDRNMRGINILDVSPRSPEHRALAGHLDAYYKVTHADYEVRETMVYQTLVPRHLTKQEVAGYLGNSGFWDDPYEIRHEVENVPLSPEAHEHEQSVKQFLEDSYCRQYGCTPEDLPPSLETLTWVLGGGTKDGAAAVMKYAQESILKQERGEEKVYRVTEIWEHWDEDALEAGETDDKEIVEDQAEYTGEDLARKLKEFGGRMNTTYISDDGYRPWIQYDGEMETDGTSTNKTLHISHADGSKLSVTDWIDLTRSAGLSLQDIGVTNVPVPASKKEVDHER